MFFTVSVQTKKVSERVDGCLPVYRSMTAAGAE